MTATLPSIAKILTNEHTIRRILMVVLALIMTHLISYQQLPFSSSYQFPLIPFSIFVIYGIFICEVNTWNYKQQSLKHQITFNAKGIWRIVQSNLVACAIIFSVLTVIQMTIFQYVMNPFRFVGLLGVCLMISTIETGVFIVLEMNRQKPGRPITLNRIAAEKKELTIVRNNEIKTFRENEVACLIQQDGCIFLFDQHGQRFTTQFESLNEVEQRLSSQFFRANRQTLVSRMAVRCIKKEVNNKLKLQVDHLNESVMVSRYKSKELKDWYKG
ncbi:MAG: LytTR family DNA-binding domain-containing protein [Cyclobacteriaceae bacterium]